MNVEQKTKYEHKTAIAAVLFVIIEFIPAAVKTIMGMNMPLMRLLLISAKKNIRIAAEINANKINLLMRFYDVNKGGIYLDNQNIQNLNRQNLRDFYGMVLQDTWIKNASIKENICLGKKDATIDEVIEACKKAHCHSFIKKLPDGYNTIIKDELQNVVLREVNCVHELK